MKIIGTYKGGKQAIPQPYTQAYGNMLMGIAFMIRDPSRTVPLSRDSVIVLLKSDQSIKNQKP